MVRSDYLPAYNGMPVPEESADPAVLTSAQAVEAFLAGTPFASRSVVILSDGHCNHAYRVHLLNPVDGHTSVVLKHALPWLRFRANVPFDPIRQVFEVEAMARVKSWLPADSFITVPKIFHFDAHNKIIIMEDCGAETVTLKEYIRSGKASGPGVAETIGNALGTFIASLHEWSRGNPDGILDVFHESLPGKKLSVWWTYERLIGTLTHTSGDTLTKLLEPRLEVDPADLEVIAKISEELKEDMMSSRDVFVMGDFWPGNMIVKLDSNQNIKHIYILDWERAGTGIRGVELGQFCAEMHLLMRFDEVARSPASTILSAILSTYKDISKPDDRLARDALAHWGGHLVIITPRTPWGETGITQEVVKEGVRFMVGSRTEGFLAGSVVKTLLP